MRHPSIPAAHVSRAQLAHITADRHLPTAPLEWHESELSSAHVAATSTWSQNPTVRAVLIPFSGFGLLQIIEFLSK